MENKKEPTYGNGKLCYIEIPAIDIQQSASFYQSVFGWEIRKRGDGATAFNDTVGEVSGSWVTGRTAWTSPGLLVYVMVFDINVTIEAIIQQGGKIVQPVGADAP